MSDIRIDTTPMNRRKKMAKKYQEYLLNLMNEGPAEAFETRYGMTIAFFDEAPWFETRFIIGTCERSIRDGWKPDLIIVPNHDAFLELVCCGHLLSDRFENTVVVYAETDDDIPSTLSKATNLVYDWRCDASIIEDDGAYCIPMPADHASLLAKKLLKDAEHLLAIVFRTRNAMVPWLSSFSQPYVVSCIDSICHNEPFEALRTDMSPNPMFSHFISLPKPEYEPTMLRFYLRRIDAHASLLQMLIEKLEKASLWFNYAQYEDLHFDAPLAYFDELESKGRVSDASASVGYDMHAWLEENCIGGISYGAIEATKDIRFTDSLDTSISSVKDDLEWK